MKDFSSKYDQMKKTADLVTFAEEILNGKFHFLCSGSTYYPKVKESTTIGKK